MHNSQEDIQGKKSWSNDKIDLIGSLFFTDQIYFLDMIQFYLSFCYNGPTPPHIFQTDSVFTRRNIDTAKPKLAFRFLWYLSTQHGSSYEVMIKANWSEQPFHDLHSRPRVVFSSFYFGSNLQTLVLWKLEANKRCGEVVAAAWMLNGLMRWEKQMVTTAVYGEAEGNTRWLETKT